jgi:lipopolysaccharide transport system permease protein
MSAVEKRGRFGQVASTSAAPWHTANRWVLVRDLLRELVARDIKLRYRGSVLGIAWTLLNPLAELLVLYFVFGHLLRVAIPNYAAYLFTGLLAYGWFQTSLSFATMAIVGNRELVRRPGVPSVVLPIVTVASNLVHFLLSLPILFGVLWLSGIAITTAILALPLLVALEFVLILGFVYPIATIHVWFRDTSHVLRVALQLLFYLTPVFYQVSIVPERVRWIYQINPMAHVIDAYRTVLIAGEWPSATSLTILAAMSFGLLFVGLSWFRHASYRFADEL